MIDMYILGIFNLDHSFTHHFYVFKNTSEPWPQSFPKGREALWTGSAATYLQTSYYHTLVAISLPSSLHPFPFITTPYSPQFPNNNISVSFSSLDFPHLMQPRPHLQLSRGHFGSQLDDTAHSHACSTGRVQLVPNGVTVHLSKQSAGSTERERVEEKGKG